MAPEASLAAAAARPAATQAYTAAALTAGLTNGQRRALAWWLGGCSAWVAVLVVLGGVTRLTRSGLSMTDWKFTGERRPQSAEDWEAEFARYKNSPEWARVNSRMSVEEFKFIYWMEYGHRMWGRALGLVFALPAAAFVATGAVTAPLGRRLALLLTMGGTQGLVGWWMVRSGLRDPEDPHAVPRVSPYRLAAHLTSAFAIFATLTWTALDVATPTPLSVTAAPAARTALATAARRARPLAVLLAATAVSGAFVAGLDAGRAYNTFPTMNGAWVPEEYWTEGPPGWRNAFENTAAAQLHHRALALASTLGVAGFAWHAWTSAALPRKPRVMAAALAGAVAVQVGLGITALLTYVPVELGAAHQGNALTLFAVALHLLHTLRPVPLGTGLGRRLAPLVTPVAAVAVVAIGVGAASQA